MRMLCKSFRTAVLLPASTSSTSRTLPSARAAMPGFNSLAIPYVTKAAFAKPAAGTFGNIGHNAVYGPGFGAVDFSVFKNTAITEKLHAEFRLEIFNLSNR